MSIGEDFSRNYAGWLKSSSLSEKESLEEELSRTLRQVWSTGEAAVRKQILDFIHLTKKGNFDLIPEALRDEDTAVARLALGMTALLVWEGYGSQLGNIRDELESLANRDPDSSAVCRSVLSRL